MHDITVPADILRVAQQTFELEASMGGSASAPLEKAVSAAIAMHEKRVLERVRQVLLMHDREKEEDYGPAIEALSGVIPETQWEPSYEPHRDDLVEVVLRGRVHVAQERCRKCGHLSSALWSVHDGYSGLEFHFDEAELHGRLNVSVLERAEDQ